MLSEKKFRKILKNNFDYDKEDAKIMYSYLYLHEFLKNGGMYDGFEDGHYAYKAVGDMIAFIYNLSDDDFNQMFNILYVIDTNDTNKPKN